MNVADTHRIATDVCLPEIHQKAIFLINTSEGASAFLRFQPGDLIAGKRAQKSRAMKN